MSRLSPILTIALSCAVMPFLTACGNASLQQQQTPGPQPGSQAARTMDQQLPRDVRTWWRGFGDAELEQLLLRAIESNPDLRIAVSRLRVANANVRIASAQRSLQLSLGDLPVDPTAQTRHGNVSNLGLRASYELDLWGRIDAEVDAETARERAYESDADTVQITLQRQVASKYFAIRAIDELITLQDQQVLIANQAVALSRLRTSAGYSNLTSLRDATDALVAMAAQVAELHHDRAAAAVELALLVGESPESFKLPTKSLTESVRMPNVPENTTAEAIAHRPDVAAAAQRAIAARSEIAAVRAATRPQIDLAAELGVITGIGPSISYAFLDGGRSTAQIDVARQNLEAAETDYRKTVLIALADVARARSECVAASQARGRLNQEQAGLLIRQQLTAARLAAGRDTRFTQLTLAAQALLLASQAVRIYRDQLDSVLDLYAALGNGWTNSDLTSRR